jgi:dual specificity tyrosine-phosphorylation-regulated kinase 2/3/4
MKGEFNKGERVYAVRHLELHRQFKQDGYSFKAFIRAMAEALDLFSNYYIVHCDIKPENILINTNINDPDKPFQLKIIDFGSAYNWGDSGKVRMATPEYMPPEFLNALIPQNGSESTIEQLAEISKPWSVDVWSLGAVILEIITGIPLWIPLKCKLESGSKSSLKYGLFAVKGRSYDKIYLKQKALVESLGQTLSEYLDGWSDAENLFDLLQNIFKWDPKKRISPAEILQHPYLNS